MTSYAFDAAWQQERQRLAVLEAQADPSTIRHLEALGVGPGWRCLEVGAGGGSIAAWLCRQVAPDGSVLATDLDTRFLDALDEPTLAVRRHNIVTDELSEGAFDLVHSRAVLTHLPEPDRETALHRMVAALAPGGWLLVEAVDSISAVPDPTGRSEADVDLVLRTTRAYQQLLAARGADFFYGRRLYGLLLRQGLVDVGAEGRVDMVRGGSLLAQFPRLSYEQLRDRLIGEGQVTAEEIARRLALLDDPEFLAMSPINMVAWGRRPQ